MVAAGIALKFPEIPFVKGGFLCECFNPLESMAKGEFVHGGVEMMHQTAGSAD
jgi:hypothetical protein